MKLTALRCAAVASLAVLAAGCLPGTSLARDGPTIAVSGGPPSKWLRDGETGRALKVFEVRIDRTPPSAPEGLTLVGGDDWRASNRFDINWTRPKQEQGSPVVGLEYRICPAANGPSDLTHCVEGQQVGSTLEWLDDIAVPRSGIWRLRLALRDEAGNIDLNGGATVTNLRLDADPPEVAFLAADPVDPARVSLAASDAASGVGRVSIEARRDGEDAWRSLKVDGGPGGFSAVLDDNGLPAGMYELRAHAVDKVGNGRSAVQQLNGEIVRVQLPVRGGSVLTVGRAKRGRGLDSRPIVRYGKSAALSGRLTDSSGGARAGVEVELGEQLAIAGAQWRSLGIVSTDKNGAFTYRAKAGTARTIRFQYAGTPTTRPAASEVTLRVRAATTLAPSRRSLRNGETVVLRGRLRGGPVPAAGKVVTVQARTQRGWLTFGTARARGRYRYTFTGTSTTVRYRFRAVVLREEAYPYMRGTSPTVTVLVRGSGR